MTFTLHPNLTSKTFIIDLPLCRVLFEDDHHYPWLFLVPRRPDISRIMDLSSEDQLQLMKELDVAQNILWEKFTPTQLNVAAIGNKTHQLHVHVIARSSEDPAWPGTVWDHPTHAPYPSEQKENTIKDIIKAFEEIKL
jgi:diadenosine tetraphosphate (Ap4A) HIT family hydrolase